MLKKVRIKNFKSFKDVEIEFGKLNVLVGANASGKTNFVSFFEFLIDTYKEGFDNAVSMQGGPQNLLNKKIGFKESLSAELNFSYQFDAVKPLIVFFTKKLIRTFSIAFQNKSKTCEIKEDRISLHGRYDNRIKSEIANFTLDYSIKNGQSDYDIEPFFLKEYLDLFLEKSYNIPKGFTIGFNAYPPHIYHHQLLTYISIYDFDYKASKLHSSIKGKRQLEKDGRNLSLVIKNIVEDEEKKRKLANLLNYVLDFVNDIDVDEFMDKSLFFKIKESFNKDEYIPADLLSDGTINVIAILIALYFEENSIIFIEEPDRGIHPYLISALVEMMKEVSETKQIFITTHNPEVLRYVNKEDIFLVSRNNEEGFSTISRPADQEVIKAFLCDELGMPELFIDNLLEMKDGNK